jgi:hypothetical protein
VTVLGRTDLPLLFKNGDALCLSAGAALAAATAAPYAKSADFAMRKDTTSGGLQPRSAATTGGDADMPSRPPAGPAKSDRGGKENNALTSAQNGYCKADAWGGRQWPTARVSRERRLLLAEPL